MLQIFIIVLFLDVPFLFGQSKPKFYSFKNQENQINSENFFKVIYGVSNGLVGSWNMQTGNSLVPSFTPHASSVTCMKLVQPSFLVTGSIDTKLYVWNFTLYSLAKTATFGQHTDAVNSVDKLSNGNMVSVSNDKSIRIWKLLTGVSLSTKLTAHSTAINCVKVLMNDFIATAGDFTDSTIKIWTPLLIQNSTLYGHTNAIKTLELLSNGNLVSGSTDAYAIVWNTTTGAQLNTFYATGGQSVTCIKELSDGTIAFAGSTGSLNVYKLNSPTSQTLMDSIPFLLNAALPCQAIMLYNSSHLLVSSSGLKTEVVNVASSSNIFWMKSLSISGSLVSSNCLENLSKN